MYHKGLCHVLGGGAGERGDVVETDGMQRWYYYSLRDLSEVVDKCMI